MLQRFIFKVKFHLVTAVISVFVLQLDQVEVHLHGALWNRLRLQWLRELHFVLQHIVDLLAKENLVDVDFGPFVYYSNHDLAAFFFPHSN